MKDMLFHAAAGDYVSHKAVLLIDVGADVGRSERPLINRLHYTS